MLMSSLYSLSNLLSFRTLCSIGVVLLWTLTIGAFTLRAQDRWTFSGGAQYSIVTQHPTFTQLTGMFPLQDASIFTGNEGVGGAGNINIRYRIVPALSLGLGVRYSWYHQIFSKTTPTVISINGRPQQADIVDSVTTSIADGALFPFAEVHIFKNVTVSFGGMIHSLLTGRFVQTQDILDSQGGRLSVQINREAELEDRQVFLSGFLSFATRLPLNSGKSLYIEPSITYHSDIGSRLSTGNWTMSSLAFGLGVHYTPQPAKFNRIDSVLIRDTVIVLGEVFNAPHILLHSDSVIKVESFDGPTETKTLITRKLTYHQIIAKPKPLLTANCEVKFVLKDKTESDRIKLTIEESLTNHYVTLLPSVFFSAHSAEIPQRYSNNGAETTQPALKVYYSILNIIGKRLQAFPGAQLKITGCNDGMTETKELSRQRAEIVRKYLIDSWHIDSSRLLLSIRNLPENPSKTSDEFGLEENRRVDLTSNEEKILEPILRQDTTRIADPPIVRFRPDVLSEASVKNWQLDIFQQDKIVRSFRANGEPPQSIDWDINNEMNVKKLTGNPIQFRLTVTDEEYQIQSVDGTISFSEKKLKPGVISAEKMSDHFSLMCFNYDETKLTVANRRQLEIIRNSITPNSKVQITGSTDVVGSDIYNKELSERRAKAIAKALKANTTSSIVGAGKDIFTFPNNVPEGRFYSRRVDIEIEKDIKVIPK